MIFRKRSSLSGGGGFSYGAGIGGAAQSTVFNDTNPILAAGVNAVRFEALNNGSSVFRELDINAVPEPGSIVLLGLGLAGIAACRRRS